MLLQPPLPSEMIQAIGNKLDALKAAGLDMIDYSCTFTGRVFGERTASDGTQSRLYVWEPAGILEAQWLKKPEGGWAEHMTRKLPLRDLPIAGRAAYLSIEGWATHQFFFCLPILPSPLFSSYGAAQLSYF